MLIRMCGRRSFLVLGAPFIALMFIGCFGKGERKIKLASEASGQSRLVSTASSVLKVSPEEQQTIAILYFKNATDDTSLNWLERGITDMLVGELEQSAYVNVVSMNRLMSLAQRIEGGSRDLSDLAVSAKIAREAKAHSMLTGRFFRDQDSLAIEAELRDVDTGLTLGRRLVRGTGLEHVFSMVNDLSDVVRSDLRQDRTLALTHQQPHTEMTQSLEAFRCYSRALENHDKFLLGQADTCLVLALEYDSTFAAAHLRLAQLKFTLREIEAGVRELGLARKYSDRLSQPDMLRLRLFEAKLNADVAGLIALTQEMLQYAPYDIDIRLEVARHFRERLELDRAMEEYQAVLDIDPANKMAHNELGYVHAMRGDYVAAVKSLERYRDLAPDEPNPHDSMGEVLMWAGRFPEAVEHLKMALHKWPSFYFSALRLSQIYGELGDLDEALKYSDQALNAAPPGKPRAGILYERAGTLWRYGRVKEGEEILRTVMKLDPESVAPILLVADMHKAMGDASKALEAYETYCNLVAGKVDSGDWGIRLLEHFVVLALQTDLPPEQSIPILTRMREQLEEPNRKLEVTAALGVLHYRAGDMEAGDHCFAEDNTADLYEYMLQIPYLSWHSTWRYFSEIIRRTSEDAIADYTLSDELQETARRLGRRKFERISRFLRAQQYHQFGLVDSTMQIYREMGSPREDQWRVVGPFPNRAGFEQRFPPEASPVLSTSFRHRKREVKWRPAEDNAFDGYVDLTALFSPTDWAVAYAVIDVNSPEERVVQIRLGADETYKLWVNDELVSKSYRRNHARLDESIISVVLHSGDNRLLLKVLNHRSEWGFYLRITDLEGSGITDLEFHPPDELGA